MTRGRHRPSSRCMELFERLSEYVDGELDPAIRREIERHLSDCAPCEAFLLSLRRTIAHVSRLPGPRVPEDIRRELAAAFERYCG